MVWKIIAGFGLLLSVPACSDRADKDTGPSTQDSDSDAACTEGTPGATDVCDGIDNDCDGAVDEDPPIQTWFQDVDGDEVGDIATEIASCETVEGYSEISGDCDDDDPQVLPGADEICDGADNDCDGLTDDDDPSISGQTGWYDDADGDGAGAGPTFLFCDQPEGYVDNDEDCNDEDASIIAPSDWYLDADADGYGDSSSPTVSACDVPAGYARVADDCDDTDHRVSPGEPETCMDEIDNDCDGTDNGCNPLDGSAAVTDADARVSGSSSYFGMYLGQSDLDGDGQQELLTSGPYARSSAGDVYAFEGLDVGTAITETSASIAVLGATTTAANYGYDVTSPGDLTGDGTDDLVALDGDNTVTILDGPINTSDSVDRAPTTLTGLATSSDITHRRLDGGASGDETLLLIGDRYSSVFGTYAGAAYVVVGPVAEGSLSISEVYSAVFYSETSNAYLGTEVAVLGDIDGDGIPEVGVGAPYYSGFYSYGGAVLVESSQASGKIAMSDAASGVSGETTYRYVGWTVADPGDTDGDGYGDLLVSARADSTLTGLDTGAAYLFTGPLDIGLSGTSAAAATLYSTESTSGYFAQHVAGAGDLDADGLPDLLVSDYGNATGGSSAGAAFVYYGALSGTHATPDATVVGTSSDYVGVSAEGVGDLNADGYDDLAIGVYGDTALVLFFGGSL